MTKLLCLFVPAILVVGCSTAPEETGNGADAFSDGIPTTSADRAVAQKEQAFWERKNALLPRLHRAFVDAPPDAFVRTGRLADCRNEPKIVGYTDFTPPDVELRRAIEALGFMDSTVHVSESVSTDPTRRDLTFGVTTFEHSNCIGGPDATQFRNPKTILMICTGVSDTDPTDVRQCSVPKPVLLKGS